MYFRLMAAIFDFRRVQTSDSIPTSLFVLPDPENMGIAVGISLTELKLRFTSFPIYFRF